MNLNPHFVPMNVCKNSDHYLKGKLFYFFHYMIQQKTTKMTLNIQNFTIYYIKTQHYFLSRQYIYSSTYISVPNHHTKGYKNIMKTF